MFRKNIILLFCSLFASVTIANAGVVYKENFSGFYANGANAKMTDADNKALNTRSVHWWRDIGTRLVELSTIAKYDTTGGLQSVPLISNPAISSSDIPAGRKGNIPYVVSGAGVMTAAGAMMFKYPAKTDSPAGTDSWVEERFTINKSALGARKGLKEVWIQYDEFIPTNYYNRIVPKHWTSKIFFLYANDDSSRRADEPRIMLTNIDGSIPGDAYLRGDFKYRDLAGVDHWDSTGANSSIPTIKRSVDLGKWQRRTFHIKLPTTKTSNNGVLEFWIRHGDGSITKNASILNGHWWDKDQRYFSQGYLLGWSNPGYSKDTAFLITNFILAESAKDIDKDAIIYVSPPKPPLRVIKK